MTAVILGAGPEALEQTQARLKSLRLMRHAIIGKCDDAPGMTYFVFDGHLRPEHVQALFDISKEFKALGMAYKEYPGDGD